MNRLTVSTEYKALRYDIIRTRRRNIGKFIAKIGILTAVLIIMFVMMLSLFSPDAFGSANKPEPVSIMVKEGDCLWDIAREFSKDKDIREVIYNIKRYNDLNSSEVYPGMIILIPYEYDVKD